MFNGLLSIVSGSCKVGAHCCVTIDKLWELETHDSIAAQCYHASKNYNYVIISPTGIVDGSVFQIF